MKRAFDNKDGKRNLSFGLFLLTIFMNSTLFAGSLQISWDAVASDNVAGYWVKYGTRSGTYSNKVNMGKVTTYALQNLTEGHNYYLAVAAYDSNGIEGVYSPECSGLVLMNSNISALANSNSASVAWQTNKSADGQVEYWTGTSSHLTTAANSTFSTSHDETLSNLIPNTAYNYRVISTDAGGSVSTSAVCTFQTPSGYAINAGGNAVARFMADGNFSGGTVSQSTNAIDLTGTINPAPSAVYQSGRTGSNFAYTFGNLRSGGKYLVRLHFAETDYVTSGQRLFRVYINNFRVLNNFDIVANAGKANKAIVKQFSLTVGSTRQILVQFLQGKVGNPKVNGLEIIPDMIRVAAINAGGAASNPYVADTGYTGGSASTTLNTISTKGVVNPAPSSVYRSWRSDNSNFDYTLSNLNSGSYYLVRMHFAESTWSAAGQRLFNLTLNGKNVLDDFDILANARAANQAIVQEFISQADSTGKILAHFSKGSIDNPLVNGVEAYPVNSFLLGINAGGPAVEDFIADAGFLGGTVSSTLNPIDVSDVVVAAPAESYQSQREGNFSYAVANLNPSATYTVRLHFAESKWAGAGQRRFNVTINGNTMLRNFDVLQYAGAPYKAVVREFLATADSNGIISINFVNGSADQAMVSAIEILN
jgi:hypothetical protein